MFFLTILTVLIASFVVFRWRRRRIYFLTEQIGYEKMLPIIGHLHKYFGNSERIINALKSTSYHALNNGGISSVYLGYIYAFVIVDAEDAEYVNKKCLVKSDRQWIFREFAGDGIIFASGEVWKERRRKLSLAFSPKIVDNFVEVFAERSQVLANKLKPKVGAVTFDLGPFVSNHTSDFVSETVIGNGKESKNFSILESVTCLLDAMGSRQKKPWLHNNLIFKAVSIFAHYKHHKYLIRNFIDEVIIGNMKDMEIKSQTNTEGAENYHGKNSIAINKRKSFLDVMMKSGYNDLELKDEVLTLLAAGIDTSAVAISFSLLLLGKYPEVQDKVYRELKAIYGESNQVLVKDDLEKMVYLERVIKESLRLYPPLPFTTRQIETEMTLPSGKILPEGSIAVISIFGLHRSKDYWGEDAEMFDPDRFSPERYDLVHPGAYIPFGKGRKNCIGYRYAMNSIKTTISTVLRRYRVLIPEENRSAMIRVKMNFVVQSAVNGYEVQLEERKSAPTY